LEPFSNASSECTIGIETSIAGNHPWHPRANSPSPQRFSALADVAWQEVQPPISNIVRPLAMSGVCGGNAAAGTVAGMVGTFYVPNISPDVRQVAVGSLRSSQSSTLETIGW
jgi:hypothetical protein